MTARIKLRSSKAITKALAQGGEPITKAKRTKAAHPDREGQFRKLFAAIAPDQIQPEAQHLFHPVRKWRFDFAWPHMKFAVEIDGGVHQKKATGHRSITGVTGQMEKLNAAAVLGWSVLRFHGKDLDGRPTQVIQECLQVIAERSQSSIHYATE